MTKKEKIEKRVFEVAEYTIKYKEDIRTTAMVFGVSKSTIHKDLAERLPQYSQDLYKKVREILDYNWSIKHQRGGDTNKRKKMARYWDKKALDMIMTESIFERMILNGE